MPRIVTYNVHRCLGVDRRLDVGRVAEVIAAQSPDIVALQEVDVGRARTGGVDQAHQLARLLGMAFHFNAALTVESESYGDAILTSLPERLVKAGPLPGHPLTRRLEPRGALWVAVTIGRTELHVINTHLGLVPREQRAQASALAGEAWLGAVGRGDPLMLVGDFNATPRAAAYRSISAHLEDSRRACPGGASIRTFPSRAPVLALDHVFVSEGVRVRAVTTPSDARSRTASDHLPLVVDFDLTAHRES
jgi:endonuclease/exonuclease/phosphatase family metal-dependent hydrolase